MTNTSEHSSDIYLKREDKWTIISLIYRRQCMPLTVESDARVDVHIMIC